MMVEVVMVVVGDGGGDGGGGDGGGGDGGGMVMAAQHEE